MTRPDPESRECECWPMETTYCSLHAAAPALLEALVSAESAMMEAYPYVVDTPSSEAVRWTMVDSIAKARAAIRAAKGAQ